MRCKERGGFAILAVVCGVMCLGGQALHGTVTNDRVHLFGDIHNGGPQDENATAGANLGAQSSGVTVDSESALGFPMSDIDAQNLTPNSTTLGPVYAAVGTGPLQRPGTAATDLGAQFDGIDDRLSVISLNWPAETAGPDAVGGGPAIFLYPRNYNGIDDRGMQFWVRPDARKQNARQDIVLDSDEAGGVYITATNNWGFHFDNVSTDSGVPVDFDQWRHVMQTTFGGGTVAVMYVDGVAVAAADTTYNAEVSTFTVGSNLAGDANFFKGVVDDIEVYVYGDSSGDLGPPKGQDYGAFNLATDNAYIADLDLLPGDLNLDGVVSGDGTGPASSDDVTAFVDGWLSVRVVDGIQIGWDLLAWQRGDMNFDATTDLLDWSILRANHPNGPALDLPALLAIPEPSSLALLAAGGMLLALVSRRQRRFSPRRVGARAKLAIGLLFAFGLALAVAVPVGAGTVLFDQSYTGADLNAFPSDGPAPSTAPSGRTLLLNGTTLIFTDQGGAELDVLYRIPAVAAGVVDPSEPLRVTITMDEQTPTFPDGDDDFGVAISDGTDFIGYMNSGNGNGQDVWFVNGVDEGAFYSDPQYPVGSVPISPQFTLVIDVGANVSRVTTVQGGGVTSGVIERPFDTSQQLDVIMLGDNPTESYGVRSISVTVESGISDLVLSIDRDSSAMQLRNETNTEISLSAYSIRSAAGSLSRADWTSVADADSDWIEFGDATFHDLSEGTLGTKTLAPGEVMDLGNAWIKYFQDEQDLSLLYLDENGNPVPTGFIRFTGNGGNTFELGDLNFDGSIDVQDWTTLQAGYGTDLSGLSVAEAYHMGDLTGDLAHGLDDIQTFREAFDVANGAGAFAHLMSVPEPGTLVLVGIAITMLASLKLKRENHGSHGFHR